jgi:hypothetical protein
MHSASIRESCRPRPRPHPILGMGHFLYIVFVLGLLLPLVPVAFFHREVDEWYAEVAWGPALERDLGFRVERRVHPAYSKKYAYITQIEPGGIFDRAGLRVGDMPFRQCATCMPSLYLLLEWSRGGYAEVGVLRTASGAPADHDFLTFEVRVPERSAQAAR